MHQNKRKGMSPRKTLLIVCLLLTFVLAAGTTVAFIQMSTNSVQNTFTPARVQIEILEEKTDTQKQNIQIRNLNTERDVPVYVRATLVIHWQDTIDGTMQIIAPPAGGSVAVGKVMDDWFQVGDTYYYKYVLQPGMESSVMLEPIKVTLPDGSTAQCVVDVRAEAIQAEPAAAVESAWPVKVGADGSLSAK